MFKKINFSSPLGIALTVAGLVMVLSPEARRAVRRMMVRGTAGVMDAMEQAGGLTAGMMNQRANGVHPDAHPQESSTRSQVVPSVGSTDVDMIVQPTGPVNPSPDMR